MEDLRLFGNMLEKLISENDISHDFLCEKLDCSKELLYRLLKGCVLPTFEQLDTLSGIFNVTADELLSGDRNHYEASVVHYMYDFKRPGSREEILDIIENYAELASAVE